MEKLRYKLMFSKGTGILLSLVGAFFILCSIMYSLDAPVYGYRTAAAVAVISAVLFEIVIVTWSIISIKLQKEYYDTGRQGMNAELDLKSTESLNLTYSYGKSETVKVKYPIEYYEMLNPDELKEAKEEWEKHLFVIMDNYYRLSSICFPDVNEKWYDIFIEIRYEGGVPDRSGIDRLEDSIGPDFVPLRETDFSEDRGAIKERIRDIIRASFEQKFPDIIITDIVVAILLNE